MTRRLVPWLALAGLLLAGSPAPADETKSDIDRARDLARQSADLLDQKDYSGALARATEAEALYHAPFHVAVIAESLEGLGRLAEAAAKYEALVAEPLPASAPRVFQDAQQRGKQRLSQLLAKVPSLLLTVRGDAPDVTATVDGKPYALGGGVAVRFDAGPHTIEVKAPGFRTFSRTVELPPRGGVVPVDVVLERVGAASGASATPTSAVSASASASAAGGAQEPPGSRLPSVIAFGVGGVGIVVGAITGGLFVSKLSGLEQLCPNQRCSPQNEPELSGVRVLGDVSTAGFAVGAAGIVAGAVLFFVRPKLSSTASQPKNNVWIGPVISSTSIGVGGRF